MKAIIKTGGKQYYVEPQHTSIAADPVIRYMSSNDLEKTIEKTRKQMLNAAKNLEFIEAAQYRDELLKLEELRDAQKAKSTDKNNR